ncbi:MAG: hypothetical protein AAF587_08275 [Bacteroidota bacterium]
MKSLDKYLRSPFFNQRPAILKLWELIQPCHPDFSDPLLDRTALSRHLFDREQEDLQALRYLFSDLTKLCDGFLAYQTWQSKTTEVQLHLLQAYDQRGLSKYYDTYSKKVEHHLISPVPDSTETFTKRFLFREQQHLSDQNAQARGSAYPVETVIESLDQLYLAKKLRYSCEGINRANVFQEQSQMFLIQPLTVELASFPHLHSPLIDLYLLAFQTLAKDNHEPAYFQLKNGLTQAPKELNRAELRNLYSLALNYCIKRLNQGHEPFAREIFDLYKTLVRERIIYEQNALAVAHFKNIVTLGARLKEFEWTENFIETYQSDLAVEQASNAVAYNLANLLFAKGDFRRVLQLLRSVEFTDVFLQMDAKSILVKTYFELEDYDGLGYLLSSFKMILRRDKRLSSYQHRLYSNLIKFTRLLIRFQLDHTVTLAYIEDQLKKHPDIAGGSWIREKLASFAHPKKES